MTSKSTKIDAAKRANCRTHHEQGPITNKTDDVQSYIRTRSDKDSCIGMRSMPFLVWLLHILLPSLRPVFLIKCLLCF